MHVGASINNINGETYWFKLSNTFLFLNCTHKQGGFIFFFKIFFSS